MRKLTNEEFLKKLSIKNANVIPVGKYVGSTTKIEFACARDTTHRNWFALPYNALNGSGCPECANRRIGINCRTPENDVLEIIRTQCPNVIPVGTYCGKQSKMEFACAIDKNHPNWMATPYDIIAGHGCMLCGHIQTANKRRKTRDKFTSEILLVNDQIEVVGNYTGNHVPIECACKRNIDHPHWFAQPSDLLNGTGCPTCLESTGERELRMILDKYGIVFDSQHRFEDCRYKHTLPFDFFLPEMNVCLEFQGEQHTNPSKGNFSGRMTDEELITQFKELQIRDQIKADYCVSNHILLYCIPYTARGHIECWLRENTILFSSLNGEDFS